MKPIQFFSHNKTISSLLQLTLDVKGAHSLQCQDPPERLPYYYQGPVLIDDDATVLYILPILQYLEDRFPGNPLFAPEPKVKAQMLMLTHGLLVDKANNQSAVDFLLDRQTKFLFGDQPTIVDITVASLTGDQKFTNLIRKTAEKNKW